MKVFIVTHNDNVGRVFSDEEAARKHAQEQYLAWGEFDPSTLKKKPWRWVQKATPECDKEVVRILIRSVE